MQSNDRMLVWQMQIYNKVKYLNPGCSRNTDFTLNFIYWNFLCWSLCRGTRQSSCGGLFVHITAGCCNNVIVILNTVRLCSILSCFRFIDIKRLHEILKGSHDQSNRPTSYLQKLLKSRQQGTGSSYLSNLLIRFGHREGCEKSNVSGGLICTLVVISLWIPAFSISMVRCALIHFSLRPLRDDHFRSQKCTKTSEG